MLEVTVSASVQDIGTVLCWTLQSLLRHICMARKDDRASPAGQQLQQAVLQCLKLIMAASTIPSWSPAWAEVSTAHLTSAATCSSQPFVAIVLFMQTDVIFGAHGRLRLMKDLKVN